jgi:uncharacterized delta-60 repeat protein
MKKSLFFILIIGCMWLNIEAQTPGSKDNNWKGGLYTSTNPLYFRCVTVSKDDKVVVSGYSGITNAISAVIVRYTSTGALDNSFNSTGVICTNVLGGEAKVFASTIQSDNSILVVGYSTSAIGNNYKVFVNKYNPDGSLDNSFNGSGIFTYDFNSHWTQGFSIYLQSDGKILIGGNYYYYTTDYVYKDCAFIMRLSSMGSLDNTFGSNGVYTLENDLVTTINSIIVDSSGNIFGAGKKGMIKLLPNGSLDNTFGTNGKISLLKNSSSLYTEANSIAFQNDKIIVTGSNHFSSSSTIFLLRYNSDGSIDNSFTGNTLNENSDYKCGYSTAIQQNGKIIISGQNKDTKLCVIRLNSDGTIDSGFATNGVKTGTGYMESSSCGYGCTIQTDGKILVTGYGYTTDGYTVRLIGDSVTSTSLKEMTEDYHFKAYPNPTYDNLKIDFSGTGCNVLRVDIFDLIGRNVISKNVNSDMVLINSSNLIVGKYLLRILTDNNKAYRSIIIKN